METLQRIIKIVSCVIFPLGILLFLRQTFITHSSLQDAVVTTAAALIGMIPEGLVLLTSTVMAVGIIRLSKYKVLVQELYCIETLARVDVLCLDKTGTITEGSMEVEELLPLSASKEEMEEALGALASVLTDDNPTFRAVKASFGREQTIQEASEIIPFSSEKKCSAPSFEIAEPMLWEQRSLFCQICRLKWKKNLPPFLKVAGCSFWHILNPPSVRKGFPPPLPPWGLLMSAG